MTNSTKARTRHEELPTHELYEQAVEAMRRGHDGLERVVLQLEDVVARYNGVEWEAPPSGVPTFADVGLLYNFTGDVECRAGELADFHTKLVEALVQINAMRENEPLRRAGETGDA